MARRNRKLKKLEGRMGLLPPPPPPPPSPDEGETSFTFNPARMIDLGGVRNPAAREAAIAEARAELEARGVKLARNARAMPIAPNDIEGERYLRAAQAHLIASADCT